MQTSEQTDKIFAALIAIRADVHGVAKGGRNQHDGYNYATLENFQEAYSEAAIKHGVSVVGGVEESSIEYKAEIETKQKMVAHVTVSLTAIHASGQWVRIKASGLGVDRGDKSTYKAITGARKYAAALMFDLVTVDDPERDGGDEKPTRELNDLKSGNGRTVDESDPFA